MKNFLKVEPEKWKKEREIGQVSFAINRAIIFSLILVPLHLIIRFLLSSENENLRIGYIIFTAIITSIGLSIGEWISLEYAYRKSVNNEESKTK